MDSMGFTPFNREQNNIHSKPRPQSGRAQSTYSLKRPRQNQSFTNLPASKVHGQTYRPKRPLSSQKNLYLNRNNFAGNPANTFHKDISQPKFVGAKKPYRPNNSFYMNNNNRSQLNNNNTLSCINEIHNNKETSKLIKQNFVNSELNNAIEN